MAFELFIGLIRHVFFVLCLIFTSLAVELHGGHDEPPLREHSPTDTKPMPVISRE